MVVVFLWNDIFFTEVFRFLIPTRRRLNNPIAAILIKVSLKVPIILLNVFLSFLFRVLRLSHSGLILFMLERISSWCSSSTVKCNLFTTRVWMLCQILPTFWIHWREWSIWLITRCRFMLLLTHLNLRIYWVTNVLTLADVRSRSCLWTNTELSL